MCYHSGNTNGWGNCGCRNRCCCCCCGYLRPQPRYGALESTAVAVDSVEGCGSCGSTATTMRYPDFLTAGCGCNG